MSDISTLTQMGIVIAATVAPVIVLVRLISGPQTVDDPALQTATGAAWPIGVQEEDPRPWRFTASTV